MKRITTTLAGALAGLAMLTGGAAQADITFNAARVTAKDVPALQKFYQTAFGLKEVQRIAMPGGKYEVMLNFGATEAAAKANKNAQVVIMPRGEKETPDTVAHLIFDVTDVKAVAAAVTAAGGKMEREPSEFGKSGIFIGLAVDPEGNHLEMIQRAKQ
jgi:predicted enzyme related to lactoylglutathione lyase